MFPRNDFAMSTPQRKNETVYSTRQNPRVPRIWHFMSQAEQPDQTYMVKILGWWAFKKTFPYMAPCSGPIGTVLKMVARFFWVVFLSILHIASILKMVGSWNRFHIVGIFILYKTKKKFNSINVFFMEIFSVFFIENGNFLYLW